MKTKKTTVLIAIIGTLIITSCNKDQAAVKDLSGSWLETKINDDAVPTEDASTLVFEKCKLKKEEFCLGQRILEDNTIEIFEYQISEKGSTIFMRDTGALAGLKSQITSLEDDILTLETTIFGDITNVEYKKNPE